MYLNITDNKVESKPYSSISKLSSDNQSQQDLHNHKYFIERAESTGKMGYWEYDVKNDKVWASPGARLIYGVDDRELSINYIKTIPLLEYRSKLDQMFENLLSHNDKYDVEFKIHRQNDNEVIDIRSSGEYNISEKMVYGIIQDISQQKKVEHELIKAKEKVEESDLLKSAFVSNMSHEIRTPMNGIVGCAHLLTEMDLDKDAQKEYKEIIHLCCNQLLGTINDILDMAKIESGQIKVTTGCVSINNFLKEIYESYSQIALKKNLWLRLNIDNSVNEQTLLTDQGKLNKIITTLIDNAIRFTPSGYVEFGYQNMDACLKFYVKDSGTGISQSQHEIIFQPVCQADSQISQEYGVTGLGLTITKKYVTMLGGKIWFEPQPGNGTTFFFSLPIINNTKKPFEKTIVRKKSNQLKTCLIVDDLEMNFKYLQALITPMGFNVLWAKDGNQAIDMSLENNEIDLVLMDIRLPYTNGYEATRIIKEKRPDLPIIAQSANALSDERKKALDSGCDDYITKPIYKDKFKTLISSYFDS